MHKRESKGVRQFYWKGMLTLRSTVHFYKAENLILECCQPDNEVREKDVGARGLQCIGLHCTAASTMEYVGRLFSY